MDKKTADIIHWIKAKLEKELGARTRLIDVNGETCTLVRICGIGVIAQDIFYYVQEQLSVKEAHGTRVQR